MVFRQYVFKELIKLFILIQLFNLYQKVWKVFIRFNWWIGRFDAVCGLEII
jgi:hypothetical protein